MPQKLSHMIASLREATKHRRDAQTMTDLDDRELADIGLLRVDVSGARSRESPAIRAICCHWRGAAVPQGCR
jgi:uncharacterized protein YjiS (DUF1127 family)